MSMQNGWPFGHLSPDDASVAAQRIAGWDMAAYSSNPLIVRELKRYFLLRCILGRPITMQSKAIDAAWHAFILDTRNYCEFSTQVFGEYLHHQAAHYPLDERFPLAYEEWFGEALHALWFSEEPRQARHYYDADSGNCA